MDPLRSAMTIEVTDDGIEVRAAEPTEDTSNVETLPLQGLLGLERPSSRQLSQVRAVWDYLAEKANGKADLLYQFRQIENRLAPPRLGESRLGKIHSYVKTQLQIKDLEAQRDALTV